MTRHQRNATAGAVYTYHERKKDTEQSGYGSDKARLGKDSVKDFDACNLTLQPCKEPVVTPEGVLYDKQAILEYILQQKTLIAKKMKAYENQKHEDKKELKELAEIEKKEKVAKFLKKETNIVSEPINPFRKDGADKPGTSKSNGQSELSNLYGDKKKELTSFWIPQLTPAASKSRFKKPSSKVYCPINNTSIKMKDLIPVKFTPIADRDTKTALISKKDRWMCAVTHDTLGNSVPSVVLRPTGDVVTADCVEKLIKPNEMRHPITNEILDEKRDIIPLQRGGTGFSQTNESLDVKKYRPSMHV
uniref:nitric oxide synthase-interacting protein-like n=1 Tax=Styela clava TaxID=7725 RepID=UPI001939DC25|nr:nitric oxide synthase-interacting protein-like [Styela clava]